MSKQRNRQRFLSETLDSITLESTEKLFGCLRPEEDPPDQVPESPKIGLLNLELDAQIEELHLSGDEENVSRNTDFAIRFSETTEDNSREKKLGLAQERKFSTLDFGELANLRRQRSKSVRGVETMSIFDYLRFKRAD